MSKLLWKSMRAGMKSAHGWIKWEIGKKVTVRGGIELCEKGLHASERIIDAMSFVDMEVLARVEVGGRSDIQKYKQAWSEMAIVKAYHWKKEDSVALSIYAAELAIKNFEKVYPDDKRPREAIEAAKRWLKDPTEENRIAARSARSAGSAAWSAESAAWSAWSAESAAWSAWSAESAAGSAAKSAAESVKSAAESARSAAESARSVRSIWSAAGSPEYEKILNKIEKWILKRVKTLEEIK